MKIFYDQGCNDIEVVVVCLREIDKSVCYQDI